MSAHPSGGYAREVNPTGRPVYWLVMLADSLIVDVWTHTVDGLSGSSDRVRITGYPASVSTSIIVAGREPSDPLGTSATLGGSCAARNSVAN